MRKGWELTQDAFDRLLEWLNDDRERAALRYEEIRQSLIVIFLYRNCTEAELLADEVINRVSEKLPEIAAEFQGDQAKFFFGVAKMVYLEDLHSKKNKISATDAVLAADAILSTQNNNEAEDWEKQNCLEKCLNRLSEDKRDLATKYYCYERQEKINHRQNLAKELGQDLNSLRVRVHRIRAELRNCIEFCLKNGALTKMKSK